MLQPAASYEWPDETVTCVGTLCNTTTHKDVGYCDHSTATVVESWSRHVGGRTSDDVWEIRSVRLGGMEDRRGIKAGLEGQELWLTRDWQLRCRVNRQLSPSV